MRKVSILTAQANLRQQVPLCGVPLCNSVPSVVKLLIGVERAQSYTEEYTLGSAQNRFWLQRVDYFLLRADAAAAGAVAAGFFLPSISARLCLRAAIKSTTGANFFGFSTSATVPPSSLA